MELMFDLAEDAVGAQQFIFSFAEDGHHAIVLKTPDLVIGADEHRMGVEGMRQFLPVAAQSFLDVEVGEVLLLGGRAGVGGSLVGVGGAMDGLVFLLGGEGFVHAGGCLLLYRLLYGFYK